MNDASNRTLWCGNLPDNVTEELLYELFLQAGPLDNVKLAKDREGRSRRYAFIEFRHDESVPYTIELMNGIRLLGNPLALKARTGSSHDSPAGGQFHRSISAPDVANGPNYNSPHSDNNQDSNSRRRSGHGQRSRQDHMSGSPALSGGRQSVHQRLGRCETVPEMGNRSNPGTPDARYDRHGPSSQQQGGRWGNQHQQQVQSPIFQQQQQFLQQMTQQMQMQNNLPPWQRQQGYRNQYH